jgi:hypothetical protein
MVSLMESDELRQHLLEAERGEAAAWIDYPPTPRWWAPLFGVWTALFTLDTGFNDGLLQALGNLVLAAVMGGVIAWSRRWRGTYPRGRAPREFNPAFLGLFAGTALVAGAAWAIGATVSVWLAAVVAALLASALVAWYERTYARVASRVRARLS